MSVSVCVGDCLFAGPNLICVQRGQSRTALDMLDDASASQSAAAGELIWEFELVRGQGALKGRWESW